MSRILGLNLTQDASVCWFDRAPVCLSKERITRKKHHWGRLGDLDLYLERIPAIHKGVELVVECYSSDPEVDHQSNYHSLLRERLGDVDIVEIPHHLSHASSAFYPSVFESAAVLIIDAQGSPISKVEPYPGRELVDASSLEVASFYLGENENLTCIHKQTMPVWKRLQDVQPTGLGWFYLQLTQCIFPGEGNEGKVMGLASYGNPDALRQSWGLGPLEVDGANVYITNSWIRAFADGSSFLYTPKEVNPVAFQRAANFAAAGQLAFEQAVLDLSRWLHRESGAKKLCFAGGAALNCSANGRLLRESPFERIFIPPAPHDGGTALGNALYGAIALRGQSRSFRWTDDFLGPKPKTVDIQELNAYVSEQNNKGRSLKVDRPLNLSKAIVNHLVLGEVIAIYQGASEFGPRALGHRSILADPRDAAITDWINSAIKGRESFRPLAPLVLEERQEEWFEMDCELPFMQFAVKVRIDRQALIPAVTHVDGTARVQTVSKMRNPLLHDILTDFELETGIPVLINTSFNGKNEPLVETLDEAFKLFSQTPLQALIVPPFIIYDSDGFTSVGC